MFKMSDNSFICCVICLCALIFAAEVGLICIELKKMDVVEMAIGYLPEEKREEVAKTVFIQMSNWIVIDTLPDSISIQYGIHDTTQDTDTTFRITNETSAEYRARMEEATANE